MKAVRVAMRRATLAECRKQAWKETGHCLLGLWSAAFYFPLHSASLLHWAMFIFLVTLARRFAKSAITGLLLVHHFGQTVTYHVGPREHPFWQRTVTYSVPRVPAKPKDPPPASLIITLGWTLATAFSLLFTWTAFTQTHPASLLAKVACAAADIVLAVYTAYNFKLIGQQRRRRSLARARNTVL